MSTIVKCEQAAWSGFRYFVKAQRLYQVRDPSLYVKLLKDSTDQLLYMLIL